MACEGRVMEPLDRAARRKHMQIPTFMTVDKKTTKQIADHQKTLLLQRKSLELKVFAEMANNSFPHWR